MRITESGMVFGEYSEGECLHIEQCKTYKGISKHNGVKIAEFLLVRSNIKGARVYIVEAKSSSPNPENVDKFKDFLTEIKMKLTNALILSVAMRLNRHSGAESELPVSFKDIGIGTADFHLTLVVNGHEDRWMKPLQDALRQKLQPVTKTWAKTEVFALNEKGARKWCLLVEDSRR